MIDKIYTVSVQEDENGDLILPFPDGLLAKMGWKEGDILGWTDNKDGTFSITKKETDNDDQ
jgi:hypothetical protein